MQAGFARYGEEMILFRAAEPPLPAPLTEDEAGRARDPPGRRRSTRVALFRLYSAVTPAPVQRLED